jgi:hypothetical protein
MAEDPSLGRRIAMLPSGMGLPRIYVAPPILKRSRRGGAAAAAAEAAAEKPKQARPASAPIDVDAFGITRYASLSAELEVFPNEAERIRAKFGLDSITTHYELCVQFQSYIASDADRKHEYRRQYAISLERARKLAQTTTVADRAAATATDHHDVSPGLPSFLAMEGDGPRRLEIGTYYNMPPESPVTTIPTASPSPPAPLGPSARTVSQATRPMDVGTLLLGPALPFSPATSPDAVWHSIENVEATQRPAPKKPTSGATLELTFPIGPALPFASKGGTVQLPAMPMPATPPPASSPSAPQLTLPQYASLVVDLSLQPDRRAETLLRYRLTEADAAALDAAHQQRFAADPHTRAAFDQATATYRAWLPANRRG